MTKIFYLYDKFFELNQNFTTENVKIVKSPGFLVILFKFQVFPGFFCLNSQILGFYRFPGKVATLYIIR